MTGLEFLNYVKRTFKRDDKDVELYECILDAINHLKIMYRFRTEQITIASDLTVTTASYRVALPADFGSLISSPALIEATTANPMERITIDEFNILEPNPTYANCPKSIPTHFCIFDSYLYYYPVADKAYAIRMNYSTNQEAAITAVTAAVPFSDNRQRNMLKSWVLYFAYRDMSNDAETGKWKTLAEQETEQIAIYDGRTLDNSNPIMRYNGV